MSQSKKGDSGGAAGAGGFAFQACAIAYVAAHVLAQRELGWVGHTQPDVPVAVASETGGPGDDILISLKDGTKIEIQAKKGLQQGPRFTKAIDRLLDGILHDPELHTCLLVNSTSSRPIRSELATDLLRLGGGRCDDLRRNAMRLIQRASVSQERVPKLFRRIRVITRDFDPQSESESAACNILAAVLADPNQSRNAWQVLCRYALEVISVRGRAEGSDFRSLLTRHRIKLIDAQKQLPRAFCVDQERNPFFAGRQELLALLSRSYNAPGVRQGITGLGGVGKTQAALEFAYQSAGKYKTVLWATANDPERLIHAYTRMCLMLGLSDETGLTAEQARILSTQWLDQNDDWLLILDDVEDPRALEAILPKRPSGHVLVTSRLANLDEIGVVQPIQLEVLGSSESETFLVKRVHQSIAPTSESSALRDLAAELGGLPLALEQAAAYIHVNNVPFSAYLESYRTRKLELLERAKPRTGRYPESVATTWLMNFEMVERANPAAADLLRLVAFLDSSNIPFEILVGGSPAFGFHLKDALSKAFVEPLVTYEVVAGLSRYSLVRVDGRNATFSVHGLVQEVVRDRMTPDERHMWSERLTEGLGLSIPSASEYRNWAVWRRAIGSCIAACDRIIEERITSGNSARLLRECGYYLAQQFQHGRAERYYLEALRICEGIFGGDGDRVAEVLSNLGNLYRNTARPQLAEKSLRRAFEIDKARYGEGDVRLAILRDGIANALFDQGKRQEAIEEALLAKVTFEQLPDARHDLAICLQLLGKLFHELSQDWEAIKYLSQALTMLRAEATAHDPSLGTLHHALARCYHVLDKKQEAANHYDATFRHYLAAFSEDYPPLKLCRENIRRLSRGEGPRE